MIARLNRLGRLVSVSRNCSMQLKSVLPCVSRVLFASSSEAKAEATKPTASPSSKLLRQLKTELTAQEQSIKEAGEDMDPSAILSEFSEFLKAGNWGVEHQSGAAVLKLTRKDEALKGSVSINVDLTEVVNSNSFANEHEEFEENEVEDPLEDEDASSYGNYSSFPMVVEVSRDGKSLAFECLAEQSEDSSTLTVENVRFEGADSAYTGPAYEQLDEELKEAFDQFVAKIVKPEEMIDFIQIYSQAIESHEYKNWLESVEKMLN